MPLSLVMFRCEDPQDKRYKKLTIAKKSLLPAMGLGARFTKHFWDNFDL